MVQVLNQYAVWVLWGKSPGLVSSLLVSVKTRSQDTKTDSHWFVVENLPGTASGTIIKPKIRARWVSFAPTHWNDPFYWEIKGRDILALVRQLPGAAGLDCTVYIKAKWMVSRKGDPYNQEIDAGYDHYKFRSRKVKAKAVFTVPSFAEELGLQLRDLLAQ